MKMNSIRWFVAVGLIGLWPAASLRAAPPELPPLTTVAGRPALPGKFVWADLVTDDVPAARKFYAQLFGWTFRDLGGYAIAANDERPVAGIFRHEKPAGSSARPRWFGYISVPHVGRAVKQVADAGGKVLVPAQVLPARGEQAVCADPEGAVFGVIKSSSGDPRDFLAEPGDWIWVQLLSRDARKAADFYRAVADYEVVENTATNRLSDFVLISKGFARATVRTLPPAAEQVKPNWLPFVRVKSLEGTLTQAKELGGAVLVQPRADVFGGKAAVIADPTGGAVGVLELEAGILTGAN